MQQPKLIYISLLRTGSRSIRTTLFGEAATSGEAPCYWNRTAVEVQSDFKRRGWDWQRSFKFSVVRNPWERLVSAYEFWKPREGTVLGRKSEEPRISFSSWVGKLVTAHDATSKSLLEQRPVLHISTGTLGVDAVLRFESLPAEWRELRRRFALPALPHTHRTVHRHYSSYYSTETQRLVAQACSADIETFEYRFEKVSGPNWLREEARFQARLGQSRLKAGVKRLYDHVR